uniref:Tryptophan synthase alpha chain n=1 Tax=Sporolithon durum TaxID=48970 RepID=A0A141SCY6_9FLOR|nr:tryptophan synthase alpha subunit [Sporolithon durum]AMK96154.1 tryptophan synthase alpha subunit [Sporolithon durum]
MLTISKTLENLDSKCALIPFLTAGYPNYQATIDILYILDKRGADIIELGIPYSDALADGPIIQESSRIAINNNIYITQVLEIMKKVSPSIRAPIIIFTYYNPVLSRGIARFLLDISSAGAKGLIIPDLPLEESDILIKLCHIYNIELILFISPGTSKSRISAILSKSPGCIYLLTSYGVTGVRKNLAFKVNNLVDYIKSSTSKKIILGFGICNTKQVDQVSAWQIDGIVIGSAFINKITESVRNKSYRVLESFCTTIKSAMI